MKSTVRSVGLSLLDWCKRKVDERSQPEAPQLFLWDVLEQEFVAVHGALPQPYLAAKAELGPNRTFEDADLATYGDRRLKLIRRLIHANGQRSALCLSGGGIRSATFNLGVIQALAVLNKLEGFHFLSTVSGGGFIGSWLSAWIKREGRETVVAKLGHRLPPPPLQTEPEPVSWLRKYSNYLSPRIGLLSADTWTLAAIYSRNLLLNQMVFLPIIAAAIIVPRIAASVVILLSRDPWWDWFGLTSLVGGVVCYAWAVTYMLLHWHQPLPVHRQRGDTQTHFLEFCLLPMCIGMIGITAGWVTLRQMLEPWSWAAIGWLIVGLSVAVAVGPLAISRLAGGNMKDDRSGVQQLRSRRAWEAIWFLICSGVQGLLLWGFASSDLIHRWPYPRAYATLAAPAFLLAFLVAATLYQAVTSRWTTDADREWAARCGGWLSLVICCWLAVASATLILPSLLLASRPLIRSAIVSAGGFSAIASAILGKSSLTSGGPSDDHQNTVAESAKAQITFEIVASIFIVALVVALALATDFLISLIRRALVSSVPVATHLSNWKDWHSSVTLSDQCLAPILCAISLALFGVAMSYVVNINWFSLHTVYRNRLIRAYLGASSPDRQESATYSQFTGFNQAEDIPLHELNPQKLREEHGRTVSAGAGETRLFHVLNMTLNLVACEDLAWQQRKAESFTASCLHAGSGQSNVGYRSAEYYGGGFDADGTKQPSLAMRLGSALAISGAAASPNMGYASSPTLSFIMTLLNVRLGVWVGNPNSDKTYSLRYPKWAAWPLIAEAFGQTNDKFKYIYLSDGGHFENLGLYEMVRRRCRTIVVCDAGADEKYAFEDLGNAIRKIHIDLGVRIEFKKAISIHGQTNPPTPGKYFAVGHIKYAEVDSPDKDEVQVEDGCLLYIKPAIYGGEPADVYNYSRTYTDFPQQTTADQFFTESQFESYRVLGAHIIYQLNEVAGSSDTLADWIRVLDKTL